MAFAKLFESSIFGQLLVKIDQGEEGPEVRFYFEPENLGVCSVGISFSDDELGWEAAKTGFANTDLVMAEKLIVEMIPPEMKAAIDSRREE